MQSGDTNCARGLLTNEAARQRRFIFGIHLAMLVSMTFLNLGFAGIGWSVPHPCCLLPLVGPIAATALLLGTRAGILQGLLASAILLIHARTLPRDLTEFLCINPLSVAGLALAGAVSGLLFSRVSSERLKGPQRRLHLIFVSLGTSFVATMLFSLGTARTQPVTMPGHPVESVWHVRAFAGSLAAQLLGDTLLTFVFVSVANALARKHQQPRNTQSVRTLFRLQLLGMVSLILLIGAASAFVRLSSYCWAHTDRDMSQESSHLAERVAAAVSAHGGVSDALPILKTMVDMYDLDTDGIIAICDEERVLATNNPPFEGAYVPSLRDAAGTGRIRMAFSEWGSADDIQLGYSLTRRSGELSVVLMRSSRQVFRERLFAMLSIATTTVILLLLVYVYADRLLGKLLVDPIDHTNETLARITTGKLDEVVEVRGSSEFSSLSDGINAGVTAIRSFAEERARRIEEDLATARRIQQSALPHTMPSHARTAPFDLQASMAPARDVGGDFYDYFLVDRHTLGFLIADVSGKGIPAALFMMEAKNEIGRCMRSADNLATAMTRANAALSVDNDEMMFVTVWAATLDWEAEELTYVSAGHNPPLLRHDGAWHWLTEGNGPLLGISDAISYQSHTLHLDPGDELLLYTDGVTEAMDKDQQMYGEDRLRAFLQEHADLGPKALDDALRDDVARWADGAEQSDDITLVIVELQN